MVAFGACACYGGIPGLANFSNRKEIFDTVYSETLSTDNPNKTVPKPTSKVPEGELTIPEFYNTVKTLDQTVKVEYYIPGCPPTPKTIMTAIEAIVTNNLPPVGSTIAGKKTLCDECPRTKEERRITKLYRPHEIIPEPELCLLEQGIPCYGPATRSGCESRCINVNMPCRGCYGPAEGVIDQGAKMLSAIGSLVDSTDEEEIKKVVGELDDPAGLFYRFNLPASILHRKTMKGE
jgi:F420-non-reducing hydrogenase small subunit